MGVAAVLALGLVQGSAAAMLPAPAPGPAFIAPDAPGGTAPGIEPAKLRATLDAVHDAGMYGIFSAVRDGEKRWNGASGTADARTGRPVTDGMQTRVGSITKTFVATAILQQVEKGTVQLDTPIGTYLPDVFPGQRGQQVTVRMLLNHTSGIGDYLVYAFPSITEWSSKSLDTERLRTVSARQLIDWGLQAPPTGDPGEHWAYSNTNYIAAGLLLEKVTGTKAETYITRNVIGKAGLKHTYFPSGPGIQGPHPRMYESLYRHLDPPRDYSTFNMSWAWTAGSLVSTVDDLNTFYRALFTGGLISPLSLAQMQQTVPVKDTDGNVTMKYGLGIYSLTAPCGTYWGHNGIVFGAGTQSLTSADGRRQVSFSVNLTKYQRLDADGAPVPDPIDSALGAHATQALCGAQAAVPSSEPGPVFRAMPLQFARTAP
ncbi:beta-lactamase family protein [Actinomadura graeca]|uniref:Beta-lactamase family protein n=1 Tax=Actinomadura graeca TaxID=2750812 RepID=A0ABX8R187_9ACTN|nr:serine hydrolase domain-containing protein [Actinomadura graeca]QXJ24184.1 beta-lactamase family protein [Actinomadura graeca]